MAEQNDRTQIYHFSIILGSGAPGWVHCWSAVSFQLYIVSNPKGGNRTLPHCSQPQREETEPCKPDWRKPDPAALWAESEWARRGEANLVLICRALLCFVLLCFTLLCFAQLFSAMLCVALLYLPCLTLLRSASLCSALLCSAPLRSALL